MSDPHPSPHPDPTSSSDVLAGEVLCTYMMEVFGEKTLEDEFGGKKWLFSLLSWKHVLTSNLAMRSNSEWSLLSS